MKKGHTLWIIIAIFAIVLLCAGFLYRQLSQTAADNLAAQQETSSSAQEENLQTVVAPDFTVYTAEGDAVQLSDFSGKPIVLNFWASWCGPCKSEMPAFAQAYETYGGDVQFLMVNLTGGRETVVSAAEYLDAQGYVFPVFYDLDASAATTYGVYAIPRTYFIDADGYLIAQAASAINADILQDGIELIFPPAGETS